jgi:acyl-CoA synthetase (AMP-forming)/AMP-acid ligase II
LFYTGGTPAFPKETMLLRKTRYNAMAITKGYGLIATRFGCTPLPMFLPSNFGGNTAVAMVGGCNVYIPSFEPSLTAIETHR